MTTSPNNPASIFLSHTHADKPFVRKLAAKLALFGVKAWVDEFEILPGDSLIGKIEQGLQNNDYVGAVLSPRSVESEWVTCEIQAALSGEIAYRRVIIIPILIEDCTLPPFLQRKLYADFRTDFYVGFSALLRRLMSDKLLEKATLDDLRSWTEEHTVVDPVAKFREYIHTQCEVREKNASLEQFKTAVLQTSINEIILLLQSAEGRPFAFRLAEAFETTRVCWGRDCNEMLVDWASFKSKFDEYWPASHQNAKLWSALIQILPFGENVDPSENESGDGGFLCDFCAYRARIKTTD